MKTLLLSLIALVSITPAFADLQCDLVDEHDSWAVYIREDLQLGIFFDNDHNVALKQTQGGMFPGTVGTKYYKFSGSDDGLIEEFAMKLIPSADGYDAKGTLVVHGSRLEVYPMTCHKMADKDARRLDWIEAQAAIHAADMNDGSTRF